MGAHVILEDGATFVTASVIGMKHGLSFLLFGIEQQIADSEPEYDLRVASQSR